MAAPEQIELEPLVAAQEKEYNEGLVSPPLTNVSSLFCSTLRWSSLFCIVLLPFISCAILILFLFVFEERSACFCEERPELQAGTPTGTLAVDQLVDSWWKELIDVNGRLKRPSVVISLANYNWYFGDWRVENYHERVVELCYAEGVRLDCLLNTRFEALQRLRPENASEPWYSFIRINRSEIERINAIDSDVFILSIPHLTYHSENRKSGTPAYFLPPLPERGQIRQPLVAVSGEPPWIAPLITDARLLRGFDYTVTYETTSSRPLQWFPEFEEIQRMFAPSNLDLSGRLPAVAYVVSKCETPGKREVVAQALLNSSEVQFHSFGRCLNNQNSNFTNSVDKTAIFRRYRFCMVFENDRVQDYVTEKLWDAFATGCIPIYSGAPNIESFLPLSHSIVNYDSVGGTPEKLISHLAHLNSLSGSTEVEAMHAWRFLPFTQLSFGFRLRVLHSLRQNWVCDVCQIAFYAKLRASLGIRADDGEAVLMPRILRRMSAQSKPT